MELVRALHRGHFKAIWVRAFRLFPFGAVDFCQQQGTDRKVTNYFPHGLIFIDPTSRVVLSLAGGLIGVLMAAWGVSLFSAMAPTWFPLREQIKRMDPCWHFQQ
ncbi:MAG TPA: hypothetical protein VK752_17815 [Bryobacteraceae bacterium]|jgi:hypothetical protein|nr:hypothetical protein [Bryobacteraceae bacterium]